MTRVVEIPREEWEDEIPQTGDIAVVLRHKDQHYHVRDVYTSKDVYDVLDAVVDQNIASLPKSLARAKGIEKHSRASIYFCGKPLSRRPIPLFEYGVKEMNVLTVQFEGLLGGSILLPTYSIVKECEEQFEEEWELQAADFVSRYLSGQDVTDYALKLTEDVAIFAYHVVRAKSKTDYAVAALNFAKLRSSGPIVRSALVKSLTDLCEELFEMVWQKQSLDFEAGCKTARSFLEDYEAFKKGPLVSRLYKLSMYCLANELFVGTGLTLSKLHFSKLSQEAIKREYHLGPSFLHCLLDTMLFLCEQGVQCVKLGSIEPLLHSAKAYQEWFDLAMELQVKSKCLANPTPHGFTKFDFLKDLGSAIEKGEAISKFATQIGTNELKMVRSVLCSLKMIQADCVTKEAAKQTRKAPFAILVYAGSSVGKSTFTDILFTYHGKIANLPQGPDYRHPVNFADDYQSGFTTNQWCWLIDDIAFQHPNAAQGVDASLMNVIQANNNVPYITNQADLPDKGRIPMWCEQVIGTTNVKHLNAVYYFTNPLAVQRRFPYVVELRPKEEYAKDECMLDGQNVPAPGPNEYPDWWKIRVERVIPKPGCDIAKQTAEYELVLETENIAEFLQWYYKTWKAYDTQQTRVLEGNAKFDDILLCDCHKLPLTMCPDATELMKQAADVYIRDGVAYPVDPQPRYTPPEEPSFTLEEMAECGIEIFHNEKALQESWAKGWMAYLFCYVAQIAVYCFLEYKVFRKAVGWFYTMPVFRSLVWSLIMSQSKDSRVVMHMFGLLGETVQKRVGRVPYLVTLAGVLVSGIATYKLASWMWSGKSHKLQATRKVGVTPEPKDEQGENVWYKPEFQLTDFDAPVVAKSLVGKTEKTHEIIAKGLVKLRCMVGENTARDQMLMSLGGQYYLANNHGIPELDTMKAIVVQDKCSNTIGRNLEIVLDQSCIQRFPEEDLCIVKLVNIPPKADLRKLIPKARVGGVFNGTILHREFDGSLQKWRARAIRGVDRNWSPYGKSFFAWESTTDEPTYNGMCGSPLVATTSYGDIILGIHALGNQKCSAVAIELTQEKLNKLMDLAVIQPNVPALCTPILTHELQSLNDKSVFNYLPSGVADVYGSFAGWRSSMRSRVCKTQICDEVCKRFGYEVQHGAPVMSGWEPWHIAAKEMVQPTTLIEPQKLEVCVDAFVSDILKQLPSEELKLLEVYDKYTAVNGAPGIKFVNKMPRNTSMGFPWRRSKKYFLVEDNSREEDAMRFTPEVEARVEDVIMKYSAGERYMPVFTAQLKDEATKFKKINLKKTRVFTGAPADWSVVVRMYFLSFVRVLQRNKLIFEAGPGTNPQSTEWDTIGKYLMQFGEDQIVAGDYAAFDKSMPPCVILAAYDIIIRVCMAAGFGAEEVQIMRAIAYDTAFPVVDFNGDLAQFYGSNPSGHPLTVIVNGLANSLYMRYCYLVANPQKECTSFKQNVALMTYGDDNVMGIAKRVPWFHHTSIQAILASVGITYTMADKESESVPYISLKEVSFLKREWRYDQEIGYLMAPLEEASIFKMLTIGVRSKTICPEAQAVAVMESALNEWFFHGRAVFERNREILRAIAIEQDLLPYVESSTFPTWSELVVRFRKNSRLQVE